jgi:phosphatidate cytidylyltransferase
MRQRVLTAIIAAPLALAMILLDWWTTALLIVLLLVLAAYEYIRLVRREPSSLWVNVGFGVVYLGAPLVAALWLRAHEDGVKWFLLVLAANWSTDTAALMVGKTIGKTPFAPRISPKKTWEGVIAGWITGFVATILFALLLDMAVDTAIVLLALLLPIAAILGDLLESKLKRRFHVKD